MLSVLWATWPTPSRCASSAVHLWYNASHVWSTNDPSPAREDSALWFPEGQKLLTKPWHRTAPRHPDHSWPNRNTFPGWTLQKPCSPGSMANQCYIYACLNQCISPLKVLDAVFFHSLHTIDENKWTTLFQCTKPDLTRQESVWILRTAASPLPLHSSVRRCGQDPSSLHCLPCRKK